MLVLFLQVEMDKLRDALVSSEAGQDRTSPAHKGSRAKPPANAASTSKGTDCHAVPNWKQHACFGLEAPIKTLRKSLFGKTGLEPRTPGTCAGMCNHFDYAYASALLGISSHARLHLWPCQLPVMIVL